MNTGDQVRDQRRRGEVEADEEVAVIEKEGVDQTNKMHTNLREFILTLLPKVESISMMIGISSVANSVVKCTKRIWNMDGLIAELHHKDFDSIAKDGLSSTCDSPLLLEQKYMKSSLKDNQVLLYNFHLHQTRGDLQLL